MDLIAQQKEDETVILRPALRSSIPVMHHEEYDSDEEEEAPLGDTPMSTNQLNAMIQRRESSNEPRIWKRYPKILFFSYHIVKYCLINYLFLSGFQITGAILVVISSITVCYQLMRSVSGSVRRRLGVFALFVSWGVFIYIQIRKYRYLYHTLETQHYFRMFLWQETGDLINPSISVLLVLHLDAALELLCLHIIYGFNWQDDEEFAVPHSVFSISWYEMSLFYFLLTLPIDFDRPNAYEHPMVRSLYGINNIAIPSMVLATVIYKFTDTKFNTRFRYWAFMALLLGHQMYELLMFSAAKQSLGL